MTTRTMGNIGRILGIDINNLKGYSSGLLQGKAYRVLTTSLTRTLAVEDLAIPEWKLLGQLHDHGAMKLADLADRLSVEAPLVTTLIDRLEKKQLVERESDPDDKRAKIITITKAGRDMVLRLEPPVRETMKGLLAGVSKMDALAYLRVLEAIVNNGSHLI